MESEIQQALSQRFIPSFQDNDLGGIDFAGEGHKCGMVGVSRPGERSVSCWMPPSVGRCGSGAEGQGSESFDGGKGAFFKQIQRPCDGACGCRIHPASSSCRGQSKAPAGPEEPVQAGMDADIVSLVGHELDDFPHDGELVAGNERDLLPALGFVQEFAQGFPHLHRAWQEDVRIAERGTEEEHIGFPGNHAVQVPLFGPFERGCVQDSRSLEVHADQGPSEHVAGVMELNGERPQLKGMLTRRDQRLEVFSRPHRMHEIPGLGRAGHFFARGPRDPSGV